MSLNFWKKSCNHCLTIWHVYLLWTIIWQVKSRADLFSKQNECTILKLKSFNVRSENKYTKRSSYSGVVSAAKERQFDIKTKQTAKLQRISNIHAEYVLIDL